MSMKCGSPGDVSERFRPAVGLGEADGGLGLGPPSAGISGRRGTSQRQTVRSDSPSRAASIRPSSIAAIRASVASPVSSGTFAVSPTPMSRRAIGLNGTSGLSRGMRNSRHFGPSVTLSVDLTSRFKPSAKNDSRAEGQIVAWLGH